MRIWECEHCTTANVLKEKSLDLVSKSSLVGGDLFIADCKHCEKPSLLRLCGHVEVFSQKSQPMIDAAKIAALQRIVGLLIDASEAEGNGESRVPTEMIEDAREVAFGVRGDIDEE